MADSFMTGITIGFFGIFAVFIVLGWLVPIPLYIAAFASKVKVGLFELVAMRFRGVSPSSIINPMIQAVKGGLDVSVGALEAHYMAGGHVKDVISAMIAAKKAGIPLTFNQATAIDLAGRNLFEAIQLSVNPQVINCDPIAAQAKDGIQVIVRCKITARANIEKLVGGAGISTIIARIGEAIVSCIGSAKSHKEILENPDKISDVILAKGPDAGTAYVILSVDIADVDVGKNKGAELRTSQSNADKQIAQAKAEERRSMALARRQEMRAYQEEMYAKLEEARAEVPKAMAEAINGGQLSLMDYYNLQNLIADTAMRDSISQAAIK
ncbi:flotillin-like protein FloA [bacterium]|nr:flotillin-like protein FloA [bacterium]